MNISKSNKQGCKDVFHAFLVKNAYFTEGLELPCLKPEHRLPAKLIAFSKAVSSSDTSAWVHFYEHDVKFERIWNNPRKYLPILKRFAGVISPDFSLYRDMPLTMQQWNTYRSRALAHWFQENQIPVIPNIRFSDDRSYGFCCDGIPHHCPISVGTHGCLKSRQDREFFARGLSSIIQQLHPSTLIVYGTAPNSIFQEYERNGLKLLHFESDFAASRKERCA